MRLSPRAAAALAAILLSVLSGITQTREAPVQAAAQAGIAPDLNDLSERWGHGVEASIESAYRACFRTFVIGGRIVSIRIPFGENNDRAELAESDLSVQGGGKADPKLLWEAIAALIASPDFGTYADALETATKRPSYLTFRSAPGRSAETSGSWPGPRRDSTRGCRTNRLCSQPERGSTRQRSMTTSSRSEALAWIARALYGTASIR